MTANRPRPKAQVAERLLSGGINFNDYFKLVKRTDENGEDWPATCEAMGDADFAYAEEQEKLGRTDTARFFFNAAQTLYRAGQYDLSELTDEKLRIYHKLDESTRRAAKLYNPPWEEIRIPYKGYEMEGWLMLPQNMKPNNPILLMIPGATGFKEEYITQCAPHVERGTAVLLMDGPGQGTTLYFNKGYLEVEVEKAYSVMIDWIKADGRFGKIGIQGGSSGGYYVPRAAATDKRIEACAINGGTYYQEGILDFNYVYRHKFATLFGVEDDEMDKIFPQMNLEGLCDKITCPILIVNGDKDPIANPKWSVKIYEEVSSADKTIKLYPGGWHCSVGYDNEAFRYMADWMAEHLR